MYKELVERLRKMYTLCALDELKDASDAIEKLLSENIPVSYTHLDVYKRQPITTLPILNLMKQSWKSI